MTSLNGLQSFNRIAIEIDNCENETVSKQAVSGKMTKDFDLFLLKLIQDILTKIYDSNKNTGIQKEFPRVLVQDSTIVKLPLRLFEEMSGVANKTTQVANARMQVVYDLVSEQFLKFEIEPYSKNDLKAAPEMELQKDDLSLRDRGYLTAGEINRHIASESYYIYRHKFDVIYLNKNTYQHIDLLSLLIKKRRIDITVRLNASPKTKVRLIAEPINADIANKRKNKAKRENKNLSPEYLKMLEWSIYITNLEQDKFSFDEIFELYSLRWKIETIFKNWKSNLNFSKIHNVSSVQLRILLHTRFLVILLTHSVHSLAKPIIKRIYNKHISFLKLTDFLLMSLGKIEIILGLIKDKTFEESQIIKSIKQYCCYDQRGDRMNFEESLAQIFD